MKACSIKGTSYEEEYSKFLSASEINRVWMANNEQPLDKIKVGNEVIDNPLYEELLKHPITGGDRVKALKLIAETFFRDFSTRYEKNPQGTYSTLQVIDYAQQRQRKQEEILSQKIQSVNIPTSRAINFYDAQLQGTPVEVHFTDQEGQEIFETFEYLLGDKNTWEEVQKTLVNQRSVVISQLSLEGATTTQIKQLKALTEIIENFDLFKSWYEGQEGVVGVEQLESDLGESQDWKTKEKSQKERASKKILALVTALPSYRRAGVGEFNFQENREYKSDEKVLIQGSLLGLPKSGDFQKNWNLISTALSGITDYTKQYDTIVELAKTHPQFQQLLKKIPDPRVKGSVKTIKQLMFAMGLKRIFSNPETIAVSLDITRRGNANVVTQQIKGFRNIKNLYNQLDKQYFAYNKDYAIQGENGTEFNLPKFVSDFSGLFAGTTAIKALIEKDPKKSAVALKGLFTGEYKDFYINKFTEMLNALGVGLSNKEYLLPSNIETTAEMFADNYKNFSNIFAKLTLTAQINRELVNQGKTPISVKGPLSFIANSDSQVFPDGSTLAAEVQEVVEGIAKVNALNKKGFTNANTITGFLKKKQTELKRLTEYITSFDIELRPSSYLTADDKKKFVRGPWFYLTQTTKGINEAKNYQELISTPGFERFDYRKNPDMLGSIWLSNLFGLPTTQAEIESQPLNSYVKQQKFGQPVNIEIRDFNGVEFKKMGTKVGKTTTNLHPGDKVMQDFMSFFQATEMENIRFGDKSSSFSIHFTNPVLSEKLYVPLSLSKLEGKDNGQDELFVKENFIKTMSGYLESEFTRVLDLVKNPQTANTTYQQYGKNLFIFSTILPPQIVDAVTKATTEEQVQKLFELALEALPASLDKYFRVEGEKLVKTLVKTLSVPIDRQNRIQGDDARLLKTIQSLEKLNFVNKQILPKGYDLKITKNNIQYLAEIYMKNAFINNVEFMKVFVGDMANFNKTDKDAREVFKRIPFTSSPGIPPFWDSTLEEFFEDDINQDALSIAYTGVSHKFSPIVRTVVYKDVVTFTDGDFENYKKTYDSGLWDSLTESDRFEYDAYIKSDEESNAQGVVTLDFYRNYLMAIEGWSDNQEQAYNDQVRIVQINQELKTNPSNAETLIKERNDLINKTGMIPFPPLKLGHYGPIVEDPKLNALHKYSLIPLVPSAIIGKQLEKQVELMYKNKVDYYTFKSGSKMANYGEMIDFYKEVDSPEGKIKVVNDALSNNNVTSIHLHNLRQQQYQAPKFKGESTLSTQMMKLVFGDFYEYGQLSEDFSEPVREQVAGLYERFKISANDLVKYEQVRLENKLGVSRNAEGNIENVNQLQLASYLVKEFEKKDISESLRKFIQVDADGNFRYPLDAINDRSQIESMILNLVNSKIINQKIYGESYIQVAGTGFEGRRFAKPTPEQLEKYGANELQFYRIDPVTGETLPMEVRVGYDPQKHSGLLNLSYKEKKIGDLATLNEILKSDSPLAVMWRQKHKDLLTMVGVRIPVQGFQSMEHVIIKEFLPESVGAIMVLPAQIVVKSGGDYDIDKLTFFETAYDADGNVINKSFDLADYQVKLSEQKELKKQKQRLLSILKVIKEEIADNEAYARRKELKSEIAKLEADVKKSVASLNSLLNREDVSEEDRKTGLDEIFDKKDPLARVIADLRSLNQSNDFSALAFMNQVRQDLKEVNKKISEVEDYKKSTTNNLVATLKEILSIGELYDYLVAPNNNNVLTNPELLTSKGRKITTTDVFNPLTSWRIYAENILSKDALGIDAKINTLQKEFQLANLKYKSELLNKYYLKANKDKDGNIMLGGKRGQDGNRISKILSEFVNGHVDIAKEDWIILLGMNQETSPLAHAMILAGTPIKDIIDFIKSKPIQLVLELGNRPVIDQKINKSYYSKNSAIVNLLMNAAESLTDIELKESIQKLAASNKENKVKSRNSVANYAELLLSNPKINKYLTEFNPSLEIKGGNEKAIRDIAYLLQFGVVIAQQDKLRELTSLSDFNTSNYRTTFQSVELLQKEGGLKEAFNSEAIDFMFKKSALAQFNVGSFTLDIMNKIFPLSDSPEVHIQLNKFLQYEELVNEEDRRNAINQYKNNLLYTYVALTGKKDSNTSLLNYYRGKEGLFTKGTPNNMSVRFQELSSNPELRGNFVFNNLYIDDDGTSTDKEIVFSLRNTELAEYSKEYRESFLEGLNNANETIRNFFKDLAIGSYMQNGPHYKPQELASIVPFEAYVDYTKDAFDKLTEMKDTNPALFSNYLTLVGFGTVLTRNHTGPLLALPSFLSENYKESIDYIMALNPELVAKIAKYEEAIKSGKAIVFTQPSASVKEGVPELFESNPELANAVYEALGFEVATENIEIIPDAVGKVIEVQTVENEFYKARITSIEKSSENVILLKAKTAKGKEYSYLINLQNEAVGTKQHFEFIDSPDLWKGVYTYNVNPQQKQQAEQQYSSYLDSIFPNSKVKDIVYHGTHTRFNKFDKSLSGSKTKASINGKGFFFSNSLGIAQGYRQSLEQSNIYNDVIFYYYFKRDLANKNIKDVTQEEWQEIVLNYFGSEDLNVQYLQTQSLDKTKELFEKFKNDKQFNTVQYVDELDFSEYLKDDSIVYSALLEVNNPLVVEGNNYQMLSIVKKEIEKLEENNDSIIFNNVEDGMSGSYRGVANTYTVFEPEQIHILGNKQDIEGFKKFVTQPTTSVKGFQGYKGGFENTGKGTPQGDGKDKAMRQVANVFIGELSKNGKGSTFTSAKEIAQKQGEEPITSGARYLDGNENKYVNEIYSASIKLKGQPLIVMLARNGKLVGQELSVETKRKIKGLSEQGATFVVGDMAGVDSQFIDYLQEIGAKFTIYHTGATPRIQVSQPSNNPNQDDINNLPNINPCG